MTLIYLKESAGPDGEAVTVHLGLDNLEFVVDEDDELFGGETLTLSQLREIDRSNTYHIPEDIADLTKTIDFKREGVDGIVPDGTTIWVTYNVPRDEDDPGERVVSLLEEVLSWQGLSVSRGDLAYLFGGIEDEDVDFDEPVDLVCTGSGIELLGVE